MMSIPAQHCIIRLENGDAVVYSRGDGWNIARSALRSIGLSHKIAGVKGLDELESFSCESVEVVDEGSLTMELCKNGGRIEMIVVHHTPEMERLFSTTFNGVLSFEMLKSATIEKGSYCVVVFDIDRLKSMNSAYGHVEANRRIQKLIDSIKSSVGEHLFLRLFGDEFMVILRDADDAGKVVSILSHPPEGSPSATYHLMKLELDGNAYDGIMSKLDKGLREVMKKKNHFSLFS